MSGMTSHAQGKRTGIAWDRRTALYRFYDERENLLYAGITDDPWRRVRQHLKSKPWFPEVRHQTVTWFDTRPEAERAEAAAIRQEYPLFNIAGAVRPPQARIIFRAGPIVNLCAAACVLWSLSLAVAVFVPPTRGWLMPIMNGAFFAFLMLAAAVGLVLYAPSVARFGYWFDRVTDKGGMR